MRLAIFAKTFGRATVDECLAAVREAGLDAVQFNLSILGIDTVPQHAPDDQLLAGAREAFRQAGVEAVALSGTFNAAHPDPAVRERYLARFHSVCEAAADLQIPLVTLSSGSRAADDMWRWHPENSTAQAWSDSLATLREVASIAARYDLRVAFEPERNNIVSTAELAVRMLEQVGSDRMGTIFDAANLLTQEIVANGTVEATITDAAQRLRGAVWLAHAKELRFPEQELPAGAGIVPWRLVIDQLDRIGYDGPLVIHGLQERDVPAALSSLGSVLQESGGL
jgi:sugar phosphate isomerase/epimerase